MDALLRRRQMMLAGGTPPAPLPYTPVDYIETDGVAYINTGIIGVPPKSAELKMLAVAASANETILGSLGSTTDGEAKKFQMFRQLSSEKIGFGYYYNVSSADGVSISNSITNGTPFEIKGSFKSGTQSVGVKQYGESSFTTASKSYTKAVSSSLPMYLFAANVNGTVGQNLASGTRMYYCKIYSNATYGGLVFDGVPCYYNGQYGLWDKVSGTFKGNAASSGAFTGPQI